MKVLKQMIKIHNYFGSYYPTADSVQNKKKTNFNTIRTNLLKSKVLFGLTKRFTNLFFKP